MKLSNIITNKSVALFAVIVGLIEVGPGIAKGLTTTLVLKAILWFMGGVFTWQKKVWGSLLLAALAFNRLVNDVFLQIPKFGEIFSVSPSDAEVFGIYAPIIIICCIFLETIIMLCFIYHGLYSLKQSAKS
jgi:hypothetical protein